MVWKSLKQSIRLAMLHLLAKYREIRPLLRAFALPMNVLWKIKPYFGVLPFVFKARKSAFSAPRICTVDAGYLAKLVREPAWEIKRAAMVSPTKAPKLGATCESIQKT